MWKDRRRGKGTRVDRRGGRGNVGRQRKGNVTWEDRRRERERGKGRIEGSKAKGNVGGRRKGKGKVEWWEDRRNWKGNVGG